MSEAEEPSFTDEELAKFLDDVRADRLTEDSDIDSEFINTITDLYLRARAQVELDGKPLRVSREQSHEFGLMVAKTYADARDPDELWVDDDDDD